MGHESFSRSTVEKLSSDRTFGNVFAAFFAIIGLLPVLSGRDPRFWALALGGAFLIVAFVAPRVLRPLNRLWMRFGLVLHKIVNPLVLGMMFFVVVTPVGLLMRVFGKDPLRLRFDAEAETYWIVRDPPGPAPDSLNHQF